MSEQMLLEESECGMRGQDGMKVYPMSAGERIATGILQCLSFPFCCFCSCVRLGPSDNAVTSFGGKVVAVYKKPGYKCINPAVYRTDTVFMGLRSMEVKDCQVPDSQGNPLVASCVVTYRVVDPVTSLWKTDDITKFVRMQSEVAIQREFPKFPFDEGDDGNKLGRCWRRPTEDMLEQLRAQLEVLVKVAGLRVSRFQTMNVSIEKSMEKLLLAQQEAAAHNRARRTTAQAAVNTSCEVVDSLKNKGYDLSEEDRIKLATQLVMIFSNQNGHVINLLGQ